MSLSPISNETSDRFDFHKTLGRGSSGKVKLAKDKVTNELVAVKIVKRRKSSDPHSTKKIEIREERTIREAYIMKLLHHPYIIQLKELHMTSSHFYISMEFVEGGSLLHYIVSKGKLDEQESQRFSRQIVSALDYMHRNSIVHRDLKIENILLDRDDNIKVADFGLSNLYFPERRLDTYCGSLYFAAPELLRGEPYRGPSVDVWALGVVVYVMVTGYVPFEDPSLTTLHEKIKAAHVRYPSHVSAACQDLLQKIFVSNPERRMILADVIRHPWIKDKTPLLNYLPLRMPISLPLLQLILQRMTVGFRLGTAEEILKKLETIIQSPVYRFAADHVARIQLAKYRGLEAFSPAQWGDYDDPQTVPSAYHPLCSIYHLTRERFQLGPVESEQNFEFKLSPHLSEVVVRQEHETAFRQMLLAFTHLISKMSCQPL